MFVCAWLLPVAHTAVVGYPSAIWPPNLRDLYSVTCLFRHRTTAPVLFWAQVRTTQQPGFRDMDEAALFPMHPFGHRSRFDRFMARFGHRDRDAPGRRELARWIAHRQSELHPEDGRVVAVRFVWAPRPTRADAPPAGHWRKGPSRALARELRVLELHPIREEAP